MELLGLELRRAELWQQREGVAVADVGARLLRGEPLGPREQRLAVALARQEPLLYMGLSLLLNMAGDDVGVEQKMVKKVRCGWVGGWVGGRAGGQAGGWGAGCWLGGRLAASLCSTVLC